MKALVKYREDPFAGNTSSDELKSKIVEVDNLEDINGMFYHVEDVEVLDKEKKSITFEDIMFFLIGLMIGCFGVSWLIKTLV